MHYSQPSLLSRNSSELRRCPVAHGVTPRRSQLDDQSLRLRRQVEVDVVNRNMSMFSLTRPLPGQMRSPLQNGVHAFGLSWDCGNIVSPGPCACKGLASGSLFYSSSSCSNLGQKPLRQASHTRASAAITPANTSSVDEVGVPWFGHSQQVTCEIPCVDLHTLLLRNFKVLARLWSRT